MSNAAETITAYLATRRNGSQVSTIAHKTGLSAPVVKRALAAMRKAGAAWPKSSYCCGHREVYWKLGA